MYHCHTRFYFTGHDRNVLDVFRAMPPLDGFTHEFFESPEPEASLAAGADVILADLRGMTAEAAGLLLSEKRPEAELILLHETGRSACAAPFLTGITDVWTLPMPEPELRFHFLRWQQSYKERKDHWQTNQFLEAAINSSPNLVWYKTKDGIHEKVNDSFCATVNKSKKQVEGRGHAYIWDVEQDDPACIESERLVMEDRKTHVSEEIIQSGGEQRILTTYKSPLYDLDGSVMGTVGVALDMTQEYVYAQELIRKNQTLETIFTSMNCGIMCHSLDGSHIISVNRAALEILGYASREALEEDGFDMIAPSVFAGDKLKLREKIQSLKNLGDTADIEYRVQHPDGRLLHVMGSIKLLEENGERFYQRYLLDCTAQKLQEERERQEAERRQAELISALGVEYSLVCFFDLDTGEGRALRLGECKNNILASIFTGRLSLEESVGRYIAAGVYEEDREVLRQAVSREHLKEVLADDPICSVNYRTTCCGELRYFQMKAARVGEWSQSCGIVLGFRSIDEETRSDREKNAILEDALAQANRASSAKSAFLSNMSHDIRTPMNAIIGFTTLAITHIDRQEQVAGYLKKIMTSSSHLLSLINDILDMSHIESGKIQLAEEPCSLPDILHDLRNIIQGDVHTKRLELYMDAVDIRHEEICCDRLRLNQVLLNLLSNAIKYTPVGGMVSLRIQEKAGAPAGFANYEFHIKDTGIGMSEAFLSHIFEPFERERNSTVSGIQGTGLGMAITKNIVDIMNGTITVESRQGVGTECTVSLTLRLCSGEAVPQDIPELKGIRALVVDDDFNTCDSVTEMLREMGVCAEWTMTGSEAVLRARQSVQRGEPYFVYIIDWRLPDIDGVETAKRIRQEMGKDVPIIVLTAYDWGDIEEEAREAGVTAFCRKPLFFSELHRCLYAIVNADRLETAKAGAAQGLRTGRILLAEDNELNQEIATAILEEAGFTVEVADNGRKAVDMLRAAHPGHYHVVLMDVQMPVMNGYEAAREIRKLEDHALASIPILAMTANAFEEDKQEALRSGMNGHIAKPVDIAVLMRTLDEIFGRIG